MKSRTQRSDTDFEARNGESNPLILKSTIRHRKSPIINSKFEVRNSKSIALYLLLLLFLVACIDNTPAEPIIAPEPGAPVTATLTGDEMVVANNTAEPIYQRIFPSEILPFIEWAPCWYPEQCPDEKPIAAGKSQTFSLKAIQERDTEAITIFWWPLPGPQTGIDINEIELELP